MFGLCQKVIDGKERRIQEQKKTIDDNEIAIDQLKKRLAENKKWVMDERKYIDKEKEELEERKKKNLADSLEIEERFLTLLREQKAFDENSKKEEEKKAKTPDELIDEISKNVAKRQSDKLNK